ncbi:WD40/YVTN/BNR-like repeat-containing protein [Kribbella deserti]|uniref:WD40/YVTN/BNR-like repeat-containing protein n=1 Tax=Kribbella deserti TaxID=1926257 RepID=A0ABV6QUQ8_9ACTN
MSDLEKDLKRVLHDKADGDYVTGSDVMLHRVAKGAVRLHRRRVGAAVLSTLAVVTAGTTLALNLGNITDANPPVVANTTTPTTTPTGSSDSPVKPSTAPTGGSSDGPPVGGSPPPNTTTTTNTTPTSPTSTPTTPGVKPTVPPVGGVTVTDFGYHGASTNGSNTIRVVGSGKCNGVECYPILVSVDGGKSFQYEESAPGQAHDLGVKGDYWWVSGGSQTTIWSTHDSGKTWTKKTAPGVIRRIYGQGRTPVMKIGTGSDMRLYAAGDFFERIEPALGSVHDYSLWGRGVAVGDVNGEIGVTVSNSDHKPRMTGCKTNAIESRVSSGPGDVIWLMCPTSASVAPTLKVSTDAGRTWKTVAANVPRPGSVNHIAAISATEAIYYAGPTSKATLVRADGSTQGIVLTGLASPAELYFQTSSVGYASGDGRLLRTTDSGRTWNRVTFPAFE